MAKKKEAKKKQEDIQWLTHKEIEYRAKTGGLLGALEVSFEHWDQLCRARADELFELYEEEEGIIGKYYCGLCILYVCEICPFENWCIDSLWSCAAQAIEEWSCNRYSNRSRKRWLEWKKASKAVRNKLI